MKRVLVLAAALFLVAGIVVGDAVHFKQVSATATAQTIPLGGVAMITITNEGANEIYFRLFRESEAPIDAVASATGGVYLPAGASLEYPTNFGPYGSISIICSAAETATVDLYIP